MQHAQCQDVHLSPDIRTRPIWRITMSQLELITKNLQIDCQQCSISTGKRCVRPAATVIHFTNIVQQPKLAQGHHLSQSKPSRRWVSLHNLYFQFPLLLSPLDIIIIITGEFVCFRLMVRQFGRRPTSSLNGYKNFTSSHQKQVISYDHNIWIGSHYLGGHY